MNQQFESDVMQDLMGDVPVSSADAAFEEDAFGDGFEADGMEEDGFSGDEMMDDDHFEDAADGFEGDEAFADDFDGMAEDDYGDAFAEDGFDGDALEDAVADALDAQDSDEFLGRLLAGVGRVVGAVGRGAGRVRRYARTAGQISRQVGNIAGGVQGLSRTVGRMLPNVGGSSGMARGRMAPGRRSPPSMMPGGASSPDLQSLLQQLMPILQQHAGQGGNEMDLFEDLADWFEEEEADAAIPVIAGVAARAALRPLIRRGVTTLSRQLRRQVVRRASQAARTLVSRQGTGAIRALRPISRAVGVRAVRNQARPASIPTAIRNTAAQVATRPGLVNRLTQPQAAARRIPVRRQRNAGLPRRLYITGPVEIVIGR